jgi:phosphoribosylformylglycinamidine cyclo-ligase
MPGMYGPGEYDLAGFVVGVVDRSRVIDGSAVRAGDAVVGLPSSGLHSNGFSLARAVLGEGPEELAAPLPETGRTLGEELLTPTRIYVPHVKRLRERVEIHALAHITGGGLVDNPPRVIPEDLAVRLHTDRWEAPPIMEAIRRRGEITAGEMRRTFNMGIGMLVFVPGPQAPRALEALEALGAFIAGEVVPRAVESVEFVP